MGSQQQVAYGWLVDQAGRDHQPTHDGLRQEQAAHDYVKAHFPPWDPPRGEKHEERNREDQARKAGEQSVKPLDDEYFLVLIKGHVEIDLSVLRARLVLGKFQLPGRLAERRHSAHHWIPLNDRKP